MRWSRLRQSPRDNTSSNHGGTAATCSSNHLTYIELPAAPVPLTLCRNIQTVHRSPRRVFEVAKSGIIESVPSAHPWTTRSKKDRAALSLVQSPLRRHEVGESQNSLVSLAVTVGTRFLGRD